MSAASEPLAGSRLSPETGLDPVYDSWWVWTAIRFRRNGWSRWRMAPRSKAMAWAEGRCGAYMSAQSYPHPLEVGRCRGEVHHSLFWLEFDGPSLIHSCRGAFEALGRLERICPHLPSVDPGRSLHIYYSGNRSIHLGVNLGLEPAAHLTASFRRLASAMNRDGHAPHADLGIYTEPRLLVAPGSLRFDNGRRVIRLSLEDMVDGCADASAIVRRSVEEGAGESRPAPIRTAADPGAIQSVQRPRVTDGPDNSEPAMLGRQSTSEGLHDPRR